MLDPNICRAARGLLNWTQCELAARANVGLSTIKKFEAGKSVPIKNNILAIDAVFAKTGLMILSAEEGGPGVLLKRLRPRGFIAGEGFNFEIGYADCLFDGPDNDFDISFMATESALEYLAGRKIIDEADAKAVAWNNEVRIVSVVRHWLKRQGLSSGAGRPRILDVEEFRKSCEGSALTHPPSAPQ
jgi:transcriptional regulator with XRE-family HTH domain